MTEKPKKPWSRLVSVATTQPRRTGVSGRTASWLGAGAVALATSALFNRANTRRAEAQTPPAGDFLEVDGVTLHYIDRSTGPVVVLLHGNGVLLQDFEVSGVLDLAARNHRVIAFDRPGFGYSSRPRATVWTPAAQAELIVKALRQLGIEQAVIVGHSWGAMVALAMALDAPELVGGLVLLSGYYYATARPDVLTAALPALPGIGDLMAHTISPLAAMLTGHLAMKAAFSPAPISEKMVDFPIAMTLRPAQMRAAAAEGAIMVPAATQLSHRYAELKLPIIVFAGEGDLVTSPAKHAERFTDEVAGARLRVISAQGHLLHFAVPELVAAAITELTDRESGGERRSA